MTLPKVYKINWLAFWVGTIGSLIAATPAVLNLLFKFEVFTITPDHPLALFVAYGPIISMLLILGPMASLIEGFIPSIKRHKKSLERHAKAKAVRDEQNRQYEEFMNTFNVSEL